MPAPAPAAPAAPAATQLAAPTAAPAPARPKEIVVAQYADVVSLDPQDTNDNASYGPEKLMFEGLVGFNEKMEMQPMLAERRRQALDLYPVLARKTLASSSACRALRSSRMANTTQ